MRAAAALLLTLTALALAGCGSGSGDDKTAGPPPVDTTQSPPAQEDDEGVRGGGGDVAAPDVGQPIPDIVGTTLDGKELALADLRGKKVIVNLWSSWWITCQSEAVAYAKFVEKHPEITFVGLNVSDQDERARQFVDHYDWSWDSIIDHSRTKARRLGATYQPAMFAIDEQGRLVGAYIGYGDPSNTGAWEALATKLQ